MFTIKQRTRIQEGASWEDIESGDCYETGYEICDEDGDMIYDFADEDIMLKFDEANRKEIANSAAIVTLTNTAAIGFHKLLDVTAALKEKGYTTVLGGNDSMAELLIQW